MKKSNQAKASKHEYGVDFISNMPDPILQLILQGLPTTEEVLRTSVLSTRWRYLWTSIPYFPSLDIDCYRTARTPSLNFPKKKFEDFVTWCLANKIVGLDSLRLCCASYYTESTVMGWIKEAVNRNVKSLDLMLYLKSEYTWSVSTVVFPKWLVTCDALDVLRLNLYGHASLILAGRTELRFRPLRVLELNNVYCGQTYEIEQFITMSPLLEELILIHCFQRIIGCVRISSPKLKTLIVRNWKNTIYRLVGCMLEKAVILPDDKMHLSISHHMGDNICKVLAKLSRVESLSINLYFIQCIDAARDRIGNFPASFPNLKSLEVTTTIDAFTINVIIHILRCSPYLESLHLVIQKRGVTGSLSYVLSIRSPDTREHFGQPVIDKRRRRWNIYEVVDTVVSMIGESELVDSWYLFVEKTV
nr:hypothetical protein [Tanacetum cinerariifolium]